MNDKTDQPTGKSLDPVFAWIRCHCLNWQFISFVMAAGLAVYLFNAGQKTPELSFQISVVQVFNSESSTQSIRVTDLAGRPIGSNVYAAEIVVWNSGDAPIDKGSIREPIKIKATDGAGILGYEFLDEYEASVSHFTVGDTSLDSRTTATFVLNFKTLRYPEAYFEPPFALPELDVGWQYFDDGPGFRVRVIFMADRYDQLTVVGSVYPSGGVIDRTPQSPQSKGPIVKRIINLAAIIGGGSLSFIVMNVFFIRESYKTFQKTKKHIVFLVPIIVAAGSVYFGYLSIPIIAEDLRTFVSPPL